MFLGVCGVRTKSPMQQIMANFDVSLCHCQTRKSDKTVTNLDLTTKDNVTRDSFKNI